jgi:peptide/nickel transport system substrate-binding protein
MKRSRPAFLAGVSAIVLVGSVLTARARYGGSLHVEVQGIIRALNPAVAASGAAADRVASEHVLPLVFETLVDVNPAGGLRPLLASSWESDSSGARWRFHIRSNLVLHDGSKLDVAHVVAALRSVHDDWQVSADGEVVVIETLSPRADLAWELAHVRNAVAVRHASGGLVGTGPFRLERLDAKGLLLRAHDRYWDGRPFVDTVQIDLGRALALQLADLELGRADLVSVQATDVRRLAQRQLKIVATRPLELFALIFEPHRATSAGETLRKALASVIDRSAMCRVLLQGQADPADGLLPPWLSGYPAPLSPAAGGDSPRLNLTALPLEQRTLTLRVDPSDTLAASMGERIAVDGREAGFVIKIQAPSGLVPRADLRLVRLQIDATTPDRALARLMAALGPRVTALTTNEPPGSGSMLDQVYRVERAMLERATIVPLVHAREVYGVGARLDSWNGPPVAASGKWDLANVWLKNDQADRAR